MSSHGSETELEMLFAEWQIKDQNTAKYFAAAMAGLVAVFAIVHWMEVLFIKYCPPSGGFYRFSKLVTRPLLRVQRGKAVPGTPIVPGLIPLALIYFGINATLVFYDNPQKAGLSIIAKRFGWLALCNICLAIFLALKNTPLSFLVGYSYENVNVLHRCCGYTVVLFVVLHASTYLPGLKESGEMAKLMMEFNQVAGATAGLSIILVFLTANGFVRRRNYEVFYIVHVVLVILILTMVGLHRPDLALKALIITIVAASMWFLDHTLRFSRWIYYGVGNYCTMTPLPEEATQIVMHRSVNARPGSHAFLWIPGVSFFQRHPFTVVSSSPATFFVKAQDGLTRRLYDAARKNPGGKFRASVEGGYGNVPKAQDYDDVIVVAGGSGVTFSMAMAQDWTRKHREASDQGTLTFVWTVPHTANFEWFQNELDDLRSNPRVNLVLHTTRSDSSTSLPPKQAHSTDSDEEKGALETPSRNYPNGSLMLSKDLGIDEVTQPGRPDVDFVLDQALESLSPTSRVLVTGCGPASLINSIRKKVAARTVVDAPSITLYCEKFGM